MSLRLARFAATATLSIAVVSCQRSPSPGGPDATPPARPSAPTIGRIEFLGGTPAPGATVDVPYCPHVSDDCFPALDLRFRVVHEVEAPGRSFEVVLTDGAGNTCAAGAAYQSRRPALPVGAAEEVRPTEIYVGGPGCPYPTSAAAVTITAVRARMVAADGHTTLADATFAARYTFRGPALSQAATRPEIVDFCYDAGVGIPRCTDQPILGDAADYWCEADDADGDAAMVTLDFRAREGCTSSRECWSESQSFPARPVRRNVRLSTGRHEFPATAAATLTCTVRDARGLQTVRSTCLGPGC
jgi:hypothetical protein